MAWQSAALDVAGEYDPDTGRMRWPVVVWIVPRRAGQFRRYPAVGNGRGIHASQAPDRVVPVRFRCR